MRSDVVPRIRAPLWQRAKTGRARMRLRVQGLRALLALVARLHDVGEEVSLVEVRNWPRHIQGEAYLWTIQKELGIDEPRPWRLWR